MNLKERIKRWLFKDEIEEIKTLKEKMSKVEDIEQKFNKVDLKLSLATSELKQSTEAIENTRKLIGSICEVGTDIDRVRTVNHNNSWAVICVHGKMDYVKFVHMRQEDIRSIVGFLKNFEYSNRVIDTPMKCMIEDMLHKW